MIKKNALLLVFEGFCEFEIATAISMLRGTHNLYTISLEKSPCKSEAGLTVIPDLTLKEIENQDYDVLIIPGGDLKPIEKAEELFTWVQDFANLGKVVAAICSGVYVLARANVLKNIPYTVTLTKEQRDFFGCFDENYFSYKPINSHNKILTAQGHAYVDFGITLNQMIRDVSTEAVDFYKGKGNIYME